MQILSTLINENLFQVVLFSQVTLTATKQSLTNDTSDYEVSQEHNINERHWRIVPRIEENVIRFYNICEDKKNVVLCDVVINTGGIIVDLN